MESYVGGIRDGSRQSVTPLFRRRARSARLLVAVAISGALGLLGIALLVLADMKAMTWERAQTEATNIVSILKDDIGRTLREGDVVLSGITEVLEMPEFRGLTPEVRRVFLFSGAHATAQFSAMRVLSYDGTLLYSNEHESRSSMGDHLALLHHANTRADVMHVSQPLPDQRGGFEIVLSRRFEVANSFAGVVTAHLPVTYFARLFASVQLEKGLSLTIVHGDERLVYRTLDGVKRTGVSVRGTPLMTRASSSSEGHLEERSTIDGVLRHYTHAKIDQFPLRVLFGRSIDTIANAHWNSAQWIVAVIVFLAAIQVFLAAGLVREFRSRLAAEEKLEDLVNRDSLTNLANRRRFDAVMSTEWRRATRSQEPVALLMIDADHFKKYNDYYGHPVGDRLLETLADAIRAAAKRAGDLAARFGGEEFTIVLPGLHLAEAAHVAEQLRSTIAALEIEHHNHPLGFVTVSIGVASLVPVAGIGGPDDLVACADLALYDAKENGRNRVEAFGLDDEQPRMAA
ncbi:MAG: sensor domain-containing diguanylate cyclase [Hyphomicrobiaceae bacterium]